MITLNSDLLYEQIERLGLSRLTLDADGTVIRAGAKVAWAFRGFNPHHRKDPSYYPLLAHLAQSALDRFAHGAHQIVLEGPSLRAARASSTRRERKSGHEGG